MTIFTFDTQDKVIREKARVAELDFRDYDQGGQYHNAFVDYHNHMASLRSYPYDPSLLERFGVDKELVEGKDFEGEEEKYCLCHHCNDSGFKDGIEYACAYCNPEGSWRNDGGWKGRRLVAVPIVQKQEQPRSFTLQDMIECWEACDALAKKSFTARNAFKKQYFKSKHNIDL
jgi:hypothetical protein